MLHRVRALSASASAAMLAALFVTSSTSGALHDGPGGGCVTRIGRTHIDLSNAGC